jgi:signal transduction histidine kinase
LLCVKDTGIGIAPELLPRLFDPFFTTKDIDEGSGLGLSVVHGIVAGHEGTISFESTPGSGTAVTVQLPLHRPPTHGEPDEKI